MLKILFIIGSGSFIGGVARYLTSKFIHSLSVSAFPFGTFAVNILGCYLIGLFFGFSDRGNYMSEEWRIFLTVGFCGGFTTFSAFSNENLTLLRDGNFLYVALYASLSVFLGLLATYLGNISTKFL